MKPPMCGWAMGDECAACTNAGRTCYCDRDIELERGYAKVRQGILDEIAAAERGDYDDD